MSTQGYAGFLRMMGHTVRQSAGLFWFNAHPHVYMSFPFHRLVDPSSIIPREILGRDGWLMRFPCDITEGRPSYRIVCDQRKYDLADLSPKARNQTRRGLEKCLVRPVSFDELAKEGIRLNNETIVRQGRTVPRDFNTYWSRYYQTAGRSEGAESWGAFIDGALAAYLIAFRMEECANILIVRSSTQHLKQYPNNALLFTYTHHTIRDPDVNEISIGLESVQYEMESLDHFKYGMGFRQVPVGQRIEVTFWLKSLLKGPLLKGMRRMSQVLSNKERFSKLAGMLQWYEEQPPLK